MARCIQLSRTRSTTAFTGPPSLLYVYWDLRLRLFEVLFLSFATARGALIERQPYLHIGHDF